MRIENVVGYLLNRSPMSMRAVSVALGKAPTWARNTKVLSKDPKLSTVTALADIDGLDVGFVSRDSGEVVELIEPDEKATGHERADE